jgi:hypothetical protein
MMNRNVETSSGPEPLKTTKEFFSEPATECFIPTAHLPMRQQVLDRRLLSTATARNSSRRLTFMAVAIGDSKCFSAPQVSISRGTKELGASYHRAFHNWYDVKQSLGHWSGCILEVQPRMELGEYSCMGEPTDKYSAYLRRFS